MLSLRRVFGFLAAFLAMLGAMTSISFGNLAQFLSWDALTFYFFVVGGLLMVIADGKTWRAASLCFVKPNLNDETRLLAAEFFLLASRITLGVTPILFAIGLITMFQSMGSDISALGGGMGMSMLSVLYGFALSEMIFYPLACAARQGVERDTSPPDAPLRMAPAILGCFLLLSAALSLLLLVKP